MNIKEFINSVRTGKYTSVESYPKFWLTSENDVICFDCIKANCLDIGRAIRRGLFGRIVACDINWEDPNLYCDECSVDIESAYAEN